MVVLLLVFILLTCWTGLEAYGEQGYGPLAGQFTSAPDVDRSRNSDDSNELWGELHEALADVTLFLIILHVAGVIISSLLHGENLVRAMWTGYKTRTKNDVPSV